MLVRRRCRTRHERLFSDPRNRQIRVEKRETVVFFVRRGFDVPAQTIGKRELRRRAPGVSQMGGPGSLARIVARRIVVVHFAFVGRPDEEVGGRASVRTVARSGRASKIEFTSLIGAAMDVALSTAPFDAGGEGVALVDAAGQIVDDPSGAGGLIVSRSARAVTQLREAVNAELWQRGCICDAGNTGQLRARVQGIVI